MVRSHRHEYPLNNSFKQVSGSLGKVIVLVICTVMILVVSHPAAAAMIDSRAALMIDADSGQLIYQQDVDQKMPVASISKLLTACVIEDEVAHHQLSWQQKVEISQPIAEVSSDPNYSAIGLQAGQSYTVRDLFDAMLVKSADGAALALATASGDSIKQFNAKMVKKAHQIGLTNVTIVNSAGLCNGDLKKLAQRGMNSKAENAMTARDVAMLARYLIHHYPVVLAVAKQPQQNFTIAPGKVVVADNSNLMLGNCQYTVPNVQIDGLKTGTSEEAGACFVSTGKYQGRRIITVVLHANGPDPTDRFVQTQALYQYLANNCQLQGLALSRRQAHYPVANEKQQKVAVKASPVVWRTKHGKYHLHVHYRQKLLNSRGQLKTPLKEGQRLGTVTVSGPRTRTVDGHPLTFAVCSSQSVQRASFWYRLFH